MSQHRHPLFQRALIGMVHLLPLPGVPGHPGMGRLVEAALRDADTLLEGGVQALLLENMHDFPPVREAEMGPEVAAAMTRVGAEVRRRIGDIPLGVQVLFAANRTAVAVAQAAGLDFVRVEGWTYGHLADKGWVEASAGAVVRYRKQIEAEGLLVLADVRKKHASHAATADLTLRGMIRNLELQKADAVIITGGTTGEPPRAEDLRTAREAASLPVVVGSGFDVPRAEALEGLWDAAIVGTSLKQGGDWRRPVDLDRVRALARAVRST